MLRFLLVSVYSIFITGIYMYIKLLRPQTVITTPRKGLPEIYLVINQS